MILFIMNKKIKKEISSQLGISAHTVITHVSHIYEKLGAANAPAAITKAYQTGVLPAHSDPE